MKALLLLCLLSSTLAAVFFSEYIEGSSLNKALEIFNTDSTPATFPFLYVEIYTGGATTRSLLANLTNVNIAKTIALCHTQFAQLAKCTYTSALLSFNGDDAIVLRDNTDRVLDVIGQVGYDPGLGWGTAPTSTVASTLVRSASVCVGRTNLTAPFNPADEWIGYPVDTFTFLGNHTANCAQQASTNLPTAPQDTTSNQPTSVQATSNQPTSVSQATSNQPTAAPLNSDSQSISVSQATSNQQSTAQATSNQPNTTQATASQVTSSQPTSAPQGNSSQPVSTSALPSTNPATSKAASLAPSSAAENSVVVVAPMTLLSLFFVLLL